MTSLPETLSDFLRASAAQPPRLLLMTSVLLMKEGEDVASFIVSVYFREQSVSSASLRPCSILHLNVQLTVR